MTARVARDMPTFPRVARHYIGKAYTASMAAAHVDFCAHLGGMQLSHVADMLFGSGEATNGSWRFLARTGANTRAILVAIVPWGATGSNASIEIPAAAGEDEERHMVRHVAAAMADLGDLPNPGVFRWAIPVSAGLNEVVVNVTNTRLHSLTCYEVPRAELRGTEIHIDRSLADPAQYLTDVVAGSDVRGATELVNMPLRLRTNMRRHVFNLACVAGKSSVGAGPDYLIGSAVAADGPRILGRDVQGGATTTIPVRCKVRVSAIGGGGTTHTITFILPGGGNATIAGVNATGWWPRAGGELVDPGAVGTMAFVDRLKVTATRTAGAGNVTCDSFLVVDEV